MAKIIDEEYWDNLKEPTKLMTFLHKFLKTPQTSTILIAIGVCVAAFFWAYFLVVLPTEDFLLSISAYSQLNLEFGATTQIIDAILAAWGTDGSTRVIYAMIANFVIMTSYIFIFIGLIILATRQFKEEKKKEKKIKNLFLKMTFLPILAGIFNTIGNILMIIMVASGSSISPVIPFITTISGIIKYVLIVSSFVTIIVEIVVFVIIYIKEHR